MAYLVGNIVKFDVSFTTTSSGAAVDPTTVNFSYTVNGGSVQDSITYTNAVTPAVGTIARLSAGNYETWVDTTGLSGTLIGSWVSTGTGAASVNDTIAVGQGAGTGNTFGDLIEKVYRRVMGGVRERTVQINNVGGYNSAATSMVLSGAQTNGLAAGVILAIDLELVYITTWTSGSLTATVIRGWNGSTEATHANLATCYINPRYSRYDIGVAINDDLRSLSSPTNGLFRVGTATITYNPVYMGYDLGALPASFIDILEIRYKTATPYKQYPPIRKWKVLRDVPDTDFPSGMGLVIYESGWPGLPMYVSYSAPFIKLVNTSDSLFSTPATNDESPPYNGYGTTVNVTNLSATQIDLPPLGAEIDLTIPREISRNFMEAQPDPRKAVDVVAGAVAASANALIAKRTQRISEEADRLARQYTRVRGW